MVHAQGTFIIYRFTPFLGDIFNVPYSYFMRHAKYALWYAMYNNIIQNYYNSYFPEVQ